MTDKRKPGRPRVSDTERTQPYTISLTPAEAEAIRQLGGGNLTEAIRRMYVMTTFAKTIEDYVGLEEPYAEMADDRVKATPALLPYYDLLIDSDWDNQGEHWEWVATADIDEILSWAKNIRDNQPE